MPQEPLPWCPFSHLDGNEARRKTPARRPCRRVQSPAQDVSGSSSWPAPARCSRVDRLACLTPWPSSSCSPAAVDPATTPTPSPATSTTSCIPASAGHRQHPAAHVGALVEFLASAGTLQPGRSAGRADPMAFFLVLACGPRSGDHASTQPDHQHDLVQPGQRRPPPAPRRPRRRPGRVPGRRWPAGRSGPAPRCPAAATAGCARHRATPRPCPSRSWPAPARCSRVDRLACLIPWPSSWCSPSAVDPATAPTPSRTTSTASCQPASAGTTSTQPPTSACRASSWPALTCWPVCLRSTLPGRCNCWMCPAPGDPEALPFEILASAGTLRHGRSAGRAGPVA